MEGTWEVEMTAEAGMRNVVIDARAAGSSIRQNENKYWDVKWHHH